MRVTCEMDRNKPSIYRLEISFDAALPGGQVSAEIYIAGHFEIIPRSKTSYK